MKKIICNIWLHNEIKVRFILVGMWNTIFSYLLFIALDYLFNLFFAPRYVAYMLAAVICNIVAVTIAYFLHKHFTFKSKTKGKDAFKEYIRFYMTYIFTSVVSLILLPIFVEILKFDPKISAAIIMSLLAVVSYISHRRFSFRPIKRGREKTIQRSGKSE